jgi:hypothetical protein
MGPKSVDKKGKEKKAIAFVPKEFEASLYIRKVSLLNYAMFLQFNIHRSLLTMHNDSSIMNSTFVLNSKRYSILLKRPLHQEVTSQGY